MDEMKIAVIVGSTRPGRVGASVAQWVQASAEGRDAIYEIVDIADFHLPVYDEPLPATLGQYEGAHTRRWSEAISSYDGFVFVTPEYNRSTSGALKNAIDYLYTEWNNKAAAFVSYGAVGGVRAVEHLRAIAGEVQLADVHTQVSFSLFTDFADFTSFTPAEHHRAQATEMFDQLEAWAGALAPLRRAS